MRKTLALVAGLIAILLLAGACQQAPQPSASQPASGQPTQGQPSQSTSQPTAPANAKVVVGLNADVVSFDPINTLDSTTDRVITHIYEYLFTRDKDMKLIPMLAESSKIIDDNNWQITLKKGIKFSNGEPFNAETVKANIDWIINKDNNSARRVRIDAVTSCTVVDENTVKLTTAKPFPTMMEGLTEIYMAPTSAIKAGVKSLADNPIGTGPYKLQEWKKQQSIILARNDNYAGTKPAVGTVEFRIIPDVSARVSALLNNEVQIIPDVPPQSVDQVNSSPDAQTKPVSGRRVVFVAINAMAPGPLADVRVRQAVNYAVDVDKIIRTVLEGNASRMAGPLPAINKHVDPALKPYSYDVAKAKSLLQEAGYKGEQITLHTPSGRYLKDKEAAQAIADQLNQAGINVKLQVDEWGTMLDLVKSNKIDGMYVFGRSDVFLEGAMMKDWFRTGSTYVTYSNPKVDAALDEGLAIVDPAKRQDAVYKLEAQIQQDAPWLFLWSQKDIYGVSKKLDWEPRGDEQFMVWKATPK